MKRRKKEPIKSPLHYNLIFMESRERPGLLLKKKRHNQRCRNRGRRSTWRRLQPQHSIKGEKRHPRQPSPQQSEVMSPRDGDVGGGAAAAAVGRDSAARAPHNRQLRPSQPGRDGKRQKRRNPRPPECRRSLR